MLEQKRKLALDEILRVEMSVLCIENVDTTRGAVLTCRKALEIAQNKTDSDERKRNAARDAELRRALRIASRKEKQKLRRNREEQYMFARRAALASMPVNAFAAQLRTMKERRDIARLNAAEWKRNQLPEGTNRSPLSLLASIACIEKM